MYMYMYIFEQLDWELLFQATEAESVCTII